MSKIISLTQTIFNSSAKKELFYLKWFKRSVNPNCQEDPFLNKLTVSKAMRKRDDRKGRTRDGSTYESMEVAAATVSERCSFLLYCPRSISLRIEFTKATLSDCPRKISDCSPSSFLLSPQSHSQTKVTYSHIVFKITMID